VGGRGEDGGSVVRRAVALVARSGLARKAVMSTPALRNVAWRFVAGEDLDAGLAAARVLAAHGIDATLNHIGTHVRVEAAAVEAAGAAIACLRRIRAEGASAYLSLKLTQIGLDVSDGLCAEQLTRVLDAGREAGVFVRIDMEESSYVDRTLALYERARAARGDDAVGIVLQSYLRGRAGDVERLAASGARVRIVKGGYWEPDAVVHRRRAEIDAAFLRDVEVLLRRGRRPAVATHDPSAIAHARRVAAEAGLGPRDFELQMLYGVRPDLQRELAAAGHAVRSYVPYGRSWYEYALGCARRVPGGALRRAAGGLRGARG
jgi:proline dehydrogenase